MTVEEYRQRMIDAFHKADCDELIALVVMPTEKEFEQLERLLKTHYKKQPCEDAVRREMVRDMFCEIHCHNERSKCAFRNICKYMNYVSALPPVTPLPDKIDGMLEDAYEHGYEQARHDYEIQPCEDAVSREAVLNYIRDNYRRWFINDDAFMQCANGIKNIVPVTPKQRTGHWRHYEGMLICSECGTEFYDDIIEYCGDDVPKWCPDCGCRMFEPLEGESE